MYSPKKKESICAYNDLYVKLHGSFICNSPQNSTIQMSISRQRGPFEIYIYTHTSNHHIRHIKLTQCYILNISQGCQ